MRTRVLWVVLILAFISVASLLILPSSQSPTGYSVAYTSLPEVHFCPQENCTMILAKLLNSSQQSIDCALYDVDLPEILSVLTTKSQAMPVRLVTDSATFKKVSYLPFAQHGKNSSLMHNKFCIVDRRIVLTGSFNPARKSLLDNNDIVIITSRKPAANYEAEFEELWNGIFGGGNKTRSPADARISSYFCPEDFCSSRVRAALGSANKSIHFLTFSFTHRGIATELILKKRVGLDVAGVVEKRMDLNYSARDYLMENGIRVCLDSNTHDMHHKVFVIDSRIVITGSFNPTENADHRNDENVLMIDDPLIAQDYEQQFNSLYSSADCKAR